MARKKQVYKEIEPEEMIEILLKTVRHFFGPPKGLFNGVNDPRDPDLITYPLCNEFWTGVMLFLTKRGARRQINYDFQTRAFAHNLDLLAGSSVGEVCDHGTLNYLMVRLNPEEMMKIRTKMIRHLLRSKCLAWGRLLGQYYLVAVDGTGHLVYNEPHCPNCLTKKVDGEVVYYHHDVLDAKLILPNGMALSMATEFIENADPEATKQDCELKAFYRLTERLKRDFPQLNICLTLDALFAGAPVFEICQKYNWRFIITFKEGSMPATYAEYEKLKSLLPENRADLRTDDIRQRYRWASDIDYQGHLLSGLECLESTPEGQKKYVWTTDFKIDEDNYAAIAKGGRLRWKIENEGYNAQKTGGYDLEHAYSEDERGIKNFYLLLQIAHLINQLIEKGSLLKRDILTFFGSLRNISNRLLESLRNVSIDAQELERKLSVPFQIRFDTS